MVQAPHALPWPGLQGNGCSEKGEDLTCFRGFGDHGLPHVIRTLRATSVIHSHHHLWGCDPRSGFRDSCSCLQVQHPPDVTGAGERPSPGQPGMRAVAIQQSHLPQPDRLIIRKVETVCSWSCPTRGGGLRNVSGIGAAGECISSQFTYWKRNDLICQAACILMGRPCGRVGGPARGLVHALGGVQEMEGPCTFSLTPCLAGAEPPLKAAVVLKVPLFKPRAPPARVKCTQGARFKVSSVRGSQTGKSQESFHDNEAHCVFQRMPIFLFSLLCQ
ncbi:uncharacterized protein LOC129393195 [Pan paniscus]|uniref:uncharacterized protein LOC129393195 n=1 Tax=Pan paniscus TaxID=9597 RepID=UPI0024366DD4|nr:uncharacterized protein LOC129393195 [Pan paniscus]